MPLEERTSMQGDAPLDPGGHLDLKRLDLRQRAEPQPCGVGANAVDHGANPVRALWRQVLFEAEPAKSGMCVDGKDLFRRSIGKKRDRDRDQTAHEVGIAIPAIAQGRPAVAIRRGRAFQPNLADAAPDLVGVVMGGRAQRLERVAQLDNVTISILPVVEGSKIVTYDVDRRQESPVKFVCPVILYG